MRLHSKGQIDTSPPPASAKQHRLLPSHARPATSKIDELATCMLSVTKGIRPVHRVLIVESHRRSIIAISDEH